jgi:type IX secretion system PorP/SprF family membrane protein
MLNLKIKHWLWKLLHEISMKKVVLSFLLLLISIGSVVSQFDPQFSQYMFHNSAFNPAAVGEGDMIQITLQPRIQWVGMPNGGKTTEFSINSPFKIGNINQGIGLKFLNDKVGLFTNQSAHFQYAYKRKIGVGVLSVGADVGFESIGFRGDSVRNNSLLENFYDFSSDTEIPKTAVAGMGFDISIGAFYSTPKYYAGISILHLNNPIVNWGDLNKFQHYGSLYLTGGYNWVLPDSKYIFKPSSLVKVDFSSLDYRRFQWDLTGRMEYDSKYWGGVSYRLQDAVVFLLGINIGSGLSIGYSYDLPTTQILSVSSGSHELLVMYSFAYVFGKRNSKYKSIRIL